MILVCVRTVDSGLVCGCTPGGRALALAMAPPQFIVTTVKTKQNPPPAQLLPGSRSPAPSHQPNLDFYVLESGAPYLNTATADITTNSNHHRFCDRGKKVDREKLGKIFSELFSSYWKLFLGLVL